MDKKFSRIYLIELLGVFALVYFAAGAVLVNYLSTGGQDPATLPLNGHQPGVVGVALAQGLILAVMLALTAPLTGGYLNPAVSIMLWVFNRLDTARMCWLVGAQLLGGVLAGLCLRMTFSVAVLQAAGFGTPHLNLQAYGNIFRDSLLAGTGIEFILTFFLTFAIFGLARERGKAALAGLAAGAVLAAGVLMAYSLTGAAANPARWFGTVFWEWADSDTRNPLADAFVYIAGPIVGALAAGLFVFKIYIPAEPEKPEPPATTTTAIKAKK
jgi:aquaporin Z